MFNINTFFADMALNNDNTSNVNTSCANAVNKKHIMPKFPLISFFSRHDIIKYEDKTVLIELANLYQHNKERFVAMEYWQKVYDIDKDEQAREILAEFYYSEGNFDKAQE